MEALALKALDVIGDQITKAIDRQTEAIDRQTNMHRQLTLALLAKATAIMITWTAVQSKLKVLPEPWVTEAMEGLNDGLRMLRNTLVDTAPRPSTD